MALAQRIGRSRHRLILLVLTAVSLLTLDLNGFGPLENSTRICSRRPAPGDRGRWCCCVAVLQRVERRLQL